MSTFCRSSVRLIFRRILDRVLHQHDLDARIASHVDALDVFGWRVVEFRPLRTDGEVSLWSITARRHDLDASMCMTAEDPAEALAELVRYASVDAAGAL